MDSDKILIPYPNFVVFNFEAILKRVNISKTIDLVYKNDNIPASVAVSNNFSNKPNLIEDPDSKNLILLFVEDIVKVVSQQNPEPSEFKMLPKKIQKSLGRWD